jgi:hypothetical protein
MSKDGTVQPSPAPCGTEQAEAPAACAVGLAGALPTVPGVCGPKRCACLTSAKGTRSPNSRCSAPALVPNDCDDPCVFPVRSLWAPPTGLHLGIAGGEPLERDGCQKGLLALPSGWSSGYASMQRGVGCDDHPALRCLIGIGSCDTAMAVAQVAAPPTGISGAGVAPGRDGCAPGSAQAVLPGGRAPGTGTAPSLVASRPPAQSHRA